MKPNRFLNAGSLSLSLLHMKLEETSDAHDVGRSTIYQKMIDLFFFHLFLLHFFFFVCADDVFLTSCSILFVVCCLVIISFVATLYVCSEGMLKAFIPRHCSVCA